MSYKKCEDLISAKAIAITTPIDLSMIPDAEGLIAYQARVSNPDNQNNYATADKLLAYCAREKHWSVFAMANLVIEVNVPRDISRQVLRHKSFDFQEFCMAGDTEVYFDMPGQVSKGKTGLYKLTLEELYRKWTSPNEWPTINQQDRVRDMNIRVYDEDTKELTHSRIKEVFCTGEKDVYEIELENGKKIKSTKEHKVLTDKGFKSLEEGFGLNHTESGTAYINQTDLFIGCNGVPVWQSKEWMIQANEESLNHPRGRQYMADKAECSLHTIKKWMRIFQLQYTQDQINAKAAPIWNSGKTGYSTGKRTLETIEKMRSSAKRGSDSNLWRGGVQQSYRKQVADWAHSIRKEILLKFEHKCLHCGISKKLELDHIISVAESKELAFDKNNLQVLCERCHDEKHAIAGDHKKWTLNRDPKSRRAAKWSKIKKVTYLGKQMTYDLEVEHHSHNYVANGVIVHNSGRYAEYDSNKFCIRECRLQDLKNRQNSIKCTDEVLNGQWEDLQIQHLNSSIEKYQWALDNGIAKEVARVVLPEGLVMSTMYLNGTVRSFIHYCQVRMKNGTQEEHMWLADLIADVFVTYFPSLAQHVGKIVTE